MQKHSYEEIRNVVVDVLVGVERVTHSPKHYVSLVDGVGEVFARRETAGPLPPVRPALHPQDEEFVRDVFWDLFRQGHITLGSNNSNPAWPHFRLSNFGAATLGKQGVSRFHDTASYLSIVKQRVPDVGAETQLYLEEAIAAFYADCQLAATVMLGVAAEAEFLHLLSVAENSQSHSDRFKSAAKDGFIRGRIIKFQSALAPIKATLTPKQHFEDLDTNLSLIQSVLRISRNDAGHPSGANPPDREQVYVYLQLFVPFAEQLKRLRDALA